jgi:TonB family protein
MAQEKAAKIIDLGASREAAGADQAGTAGDFLASARRAAGMSLTAVSDATKIKVEHLEAIEASNGAALPALVYAVGFVKVYAKFLGLDAGSVASRFKKDIGAAAPPQVEEIHDNTTSMSPHFNEGARMVSIFGVVAILIFVFWIVLQITGNPGDVERIQATSAPEQRVRLGTAFVPPPVAAPALHPRSTAPANEMTSPALSGDTAPGVPAPEVTSPATDYNVPSEEAANEPALQAAPQTLVEATPETSALEVAALDSPAAEPTAREQSSDVLTPLIATPLVVLPFVNEAPAPLLERTEPSVLLKRAPAPVIVDAKLTRSIAPRYPNRCTRNALPLETVTVVFDVTERGRAANARIVGSSNACFNNAALTTIRRWRFDPKTIDGVVRADIGKQATLNFRR